MKLLLRALITALLLSVLPSSPAFALDDSPCGTVYRIQPGDTLNTIADECEVTVDDILRANPTITNPSRIYAGQDLNIPTGAEIQAAQPEPPVPTGSTYVLQRGDTLGQLAIRFDTSIRELMDLNPEIESISRIYAGQIIVLPEGANAPKVSLSTTTPRPGGPVDVTVTGFPGNVNIDLRVGKQEQPFTRAYDLRTNPSGEVTLRDTFPSTAKKDEKWEIRAVTTDLKHITEAVSPTITVSQ